MNSIRFFALISLLCSSLAVQALSPVRTAAVVTFASLYGLSIHQAVKGKTENRKKLGVVGTAVGSFILGLTFGGDNDNGRGSGIGTGIRSPRCLCTYLNKLSKILLFTRFTKKLAASY